ncbi:MAG: ABC transporter substrate-binding protein [Nocardioidaceae bacterium]
MKKMQWTRVAIVTSAAAALALTGCSGSSGGDTGGGDGAKKIVVGSSVPLTGPVASAGKGQGCGFEVFFDAANKNGGIAGYEVEVSTKDNQYEGSASATVAQELVAEGAVAIFAGGTVPVDAARGATQSSGLMLTGSADGAAFAPPQAPGEYGVYPAYADDMAAAIDYAAEGLGAKSVSVVLALGAGDNSIERLPEIEKAGKAEVATSIEMNLADPQFASWAKQLKDANADVVYVQHVDTTLAQLQKEADNIGYNPKWILTPFGYGPGYLELAGDLAEGTTVAQWAWPSAATDQQSVKDFVAAVEDYTPECAEEVDNPNTNVGYNHAAIIGKAIELAAESGEVNAETMTAAIADYEGALGTIDNVKFSDDSHAGGQGVSYWEIKDGKLELAGDWRPVGSAE